MTDKPTCSSCSLAKELILDASKTICSDPNHEPYPRVYDCPIKGRWMSPEDVCLSHPDARAYLMKDVIAELNHKQVNAQGEISHHFLDQDCYREGIIKTCKEALSLIRDGVKK